MIDWTNPEPPQPRTIASICRCSSPEMHAQRAADQARSVAAYDVAEANKRADAAVSAAAKREAELNARTPRTDQYEIVRAEQVGPHMVLEVLYPNCAKCSYEGRKVMVFFCVNALDAMYWRSIDPHFRNPARPRPRREAPPPAARFPATPKGWDDAVEYAKRNFSVQKT